MLWILILLGIVVTVTVVVPRSGSEHGSARWYDWALLTVVPLIGGWLLAPTPIGNLLHTVVLQWFGDWSLLLFFVALAAVLIRRGDSPAKRMTLGDGFMVFPSLLLGIAIYNSSLGVDIRTGLEKMQKAAAEHREAMKQREEENKKQKAEEAKKPLPKLTEAEVKSVVWKGGKEVLFPIRTDGNWICEGNPVAEVALKAGIYQSFPRGGKLVYESATDFPTEGPRIAFKRKADGMTTEEEYVKKTP